MKFLDPKYVRFSNRVISLTETELNNIVNILEEWGCKAEVDKKLSGRHACVWQLSVGVPPEAMTNFPYDMETIFEEPSEP